MVDLPLPVGPVTRKMPCGSDVKCSMRLSMWSSKPEPAQVVEIARGAVEQAHDDAFAVERGQRGDAEIDFAAEDLDLDAAVLRQPALGDVQLGHQLQARDDGGLQLARRRFLVEEHAVDADSGCGIPSRTARCGCRWRASRRPAAIMAFTRRMTGASLAMSRRCSRSSAPGLLVVDIPASDVRSRLAVIAVDGVEDFLLGGEHGLDLQAR